MSRLPLASVDMRRAPLDVRSMLPLCQTSSGFHSIRCGTLQHAAFRSLSDPWLWVHGSVIILCVFISRIRKQCTSNAPIHMPQHTRPRSRRCNPTFPSSAFPKFGLYFKLCIRTHTAISSEYVDLHWACSSRVLAFYVIAIITFFWLLEPLSYCFDAELSRHLLSSLCSALSIIITELALLTSHSAHHEVVLLPLLLCLVIYTYYSYSMGLIKLFILRTFVPTSSSLYQAVQRRL
ncbi:hypothetical protein BDN70DRAFT_503694 [Pholiota conissans]|uniref:Transmembrane protein n=1 Tax=Pholiota conissans TaxID=109636 RepID=A0A9P6CMC6_9AGAR|nr:hypothetical protein BDN70DRAFT_503694 [Pholiota conissans]